MFYVNNQGANWYPVYEITPKDEQQSVSMVKFKGTDFGLATGEGILYRYIGH